MKEWWVVSELIGLPGMPSTLQGIRFKSGSEQWQSRPRHGRGGGKEYHISSLPDETKTALHFRESAHLPEPVSQVCKAVAAKKEEPIPELTALKGWQRRIFDARLALFREFEHLQRMLGTNKAVTVLVSMASDGTLPEPLQRCVTEANARPGQGRTLRGLFRVGVPVQVGAHGV